MKMSVFASRRGFSPALRYRYERIYRYTYIHIGEGALSVGGVAAAAVALGTHGHIKTNENYNLPSHISGFSFIIT